MNSKRAWSTEDMQERQHKYEILKFHGMCMAEFVKKGGQKEAKTEKTKYRTRRSWIRKKNIISSDKLDTN